MRDEKMRTKKEEATMKTSSKSQKQQKEPLQEQEVDLSTLSLNEAHDLIQELQKDVEKTHEKLRATQEQLEKTQAQYTDLYDAIPIGYYTFDEQGLILEVNLAAADLLSVERNVLIHTHFTEYIAPEDRDTFLLHLKTISETKNRQTCEIRLRTGDDSEFLAQLESLCLEDNGKCTRCRTAIQNITERKLVEDILRRRDSELALLNRVSQAFNSALDLDQILVTVLEEVRRLLEVAGCSIWLRNPETDELVCEQAIGEHSSTVRGWRLAPGQGIAGTVALTGKSLIVPDVLADERHFKGVDQKTGQTLRSILSVAMKVKGTVIGVLQVLDTDANRFNSTDQALQEILATAASIAIENARLNEQLQQDAEIKTQLLSEISHRVKNTLTTIIDLFSYLQKQQPLYRQRMIANLIHCTKVLMVVDGLFSEFKGQHLPLSELSRRVIHSSLKALVPDKEVMLYVPPSPIRIAPEQANALALVLNELVTNTIRHTPADQDTGDITVNISRIEESIQLEFRDNGSGYPDDVLRSSYHHAGLSLIQQIVHKDLQGELTLYNDSGAVAIIRFKTPEDAKIMTTP
jgi:PAS domain S-box-containing protein